MTVIKKEVLEAAEQVKKAVSEGLKNHIGQSGGFKLLIDPEVPRDEVWFVAADGTKHVIKNVTGFDVKQSIKVEDYKFQQLTPSPRRDDDEDKE